MTVEEARARKAEALRRIGENAVPYLELLELRIEELRNQLEKADAESVARVQGRIEECRNLLKLF